MKLKEGQPPWWSVSWLKSRATKQSKCYGEEYNVQLNINHIGKHKRRYMVSAVSCFGHSCLLPIFVARFIPCGAVMPDLMVLDSV